MNLKNLLALSPSLLLSISAYGNQIAQRPNIIFIYTDDMGIGDVGFTGGKVIATPNLDKQAAKGKIFTQYYTTAPVSSASRTALTTGMYHIRWNINTYLHTREHNVNCEQSDFLDANAPTLAKNLKSVGYKTAHIGKWHLGGGRDVDNAPSITQYGFDSYVSTWESPDPDPLLTSTDWIWAPTDSIKRWNRTAYFVDKTIAFLNENKNKPCFINLWPDDVHTPWVYDAESESRPDSHFTLENLRPVIPEFDKQLGRLFNYLEMAGIANNTLIVFTSDNGPDPGFNHLRSNNKRGVKNGLYEGGINMPFFISWPAKINAGQTDTNSVIASIDLMPTLSKIGGFVGKTDYVLDGEDISKTILAKKTYQRKKDIMWEFGRNKYYNFPKGDDRSLQLATRHKNFKFYTVPDGSKVELYDLKKDPTERENIAAENPELVTRLTKKLTYWFRTNDKQMLKKQ
jgi:arylsulfatase A-like enzyme